MITNKDIRVENGFLIINGNKYPLDGQSPEAIMQIVEDNSDTTPTENSDAPIKSGGVFTALGTKQDTLTFDAAPTAESTNPVTSGGLYNTIGDLTQTGVTGGSVAGQIASLQTNRAYHVDVGSVIGNNPNELLGAAWDKLTICGVPVLVNYQNNGQHMALMFKYNAAGDHGMAIGMRYGTTTIIKMGVISGVKSYATT